MKKMLFFVLVAALLLPACETMPWQKEKELPPVELLDETQAATGASPAPSAEAGVPMAKHKRFADVPLPEGVSENGKESYVFENSWLKIGRMVYSSKYSVNELAQFYIKEAPAFDWKLQSSIEAEEGVKLHFTKPGKILTVDARRIGVGRAQELIVNLMPDESRGGNQ